jgi:hypothetical protein
MDSMNKILSAAMIVILAPIATQAASVAETDQFSIDTTTSAVSTDGLTFAQFNAALGTLTGVSIEFAGDADSVYQVLTNSTTSLTSTGTSTTSLQLTGSVLANTLSTATLSAGTTNGVVNANVAPNPYTITYFPGSQSAFDQTVSENNLAAFTGSGSFALQAGFPSFTASGSINTTGSPGSFSGVGGGGQANGDVVVTYDYTPVPLPAALPLLFSGMFGFGFLTGRRNSSTA